MVFLRKRKMFHIKNVIFNILRPFSCEKQYLCQGFLNFNEMGRNKFSANEIDEIKRLLRLKNASNRGKQKEIRHTLRVEYGFNISDFNEQGKAFGDKELLDAIQRGAISVLDDATIADMKARHARDKARDEAAKQKEAVESGEQTDWKAAMKEWEAMQDNLRL